MRYEFEQRRTGSWSFEEMKIINETTTFISNLDNANPVVEIGRYLSSVTSVKYVLIGKFIPPENDRIQTVCFFNGAQQLNNITYKLKDTPCHKVYQEFVCYYPFDVQEAFPEDIDLVIMGVNSYMGMALRDYAGNPIGLVVLLNDITIENPSLIDHLFSIVGPTLEKNLAAILETEIPPV